MEFLKSFVILPKKSVGSRTDQPEWTMLSPTSEYLQNRETSKGCTGGGPVGGASDAKVSKEYSDLEQEYGFIEYSGEKKSGKELPLSKNSRV